MKSNADQRISGITALRNLTHIEITQLSPFNAAILLWALPHDPQLLPLRDILLSQGKARLKPEWITRGDANAVFATLAALAQYPSALKGSHIGLAVRRLLASETAVGGPYALDGRISRGTNALVACLLQRIAKVPPNLQAYLQTAASYDPAIKTAALDFILQQAGYSTNPTAFGIQDANGLWPAQQLIKTEPASQAATTALALHDLNDDTSNQQRIHDAVIQEMHTLFSDYTPAITKTAWQLITALARADTTHEIALLPYLSAQALTKPMPSALQLYDLCVANVCGWLAYMAYDSILDDEGTPEHLPTANIAARLSLQLFQKHALNPAQVADTFTFMDQANAWELANTRFAVKNGTIIIGNLPDYGTRQHLAQRSAGHALGPLIVAAQAGASSSQLHALQKGLHHFLVARQLADDLLDWQQDTIAGHASFVVTAILRDIQQAPGTYPLAKLIPAMRTMLATHTQQRVGSYLLAHAKQAQRLFSACDLLQSHNYLFMLTDNLATIGQNAYTSLQVRQDFLAGYKQTKSI